MTVVVCWVDPPTRADMYFVALAGRVCAPFGVRCGAGGAAHRLRLERARQRPHPNSRCHVV